MQRYNLFYNDVRLLITKCEQSYQTEMNSENCFVYNPSLCLEDVFSKFLSSKQNSNLFFANESEQTAIKKALNDFFIFERAAGGIVCKNDSLLSIYRFDRWDFPKGHVEADETDMEAALREVTEETGMGKLTISKDWGYTYHIFQNKDGHFVLKETHWFQMQTTSDKEPIPQTAENILMAKWIPFSQRNIILENTFPTIVELLGKNNSDLFPSVKILMEKK